MKASKLFYFVLVSLLLSFAGWSFAQAGTVSEKNGTTTWQAGVDGVEVQWGKDGGVSRIYSTIYEPIDIQDRRGINTGYKIAELKADAAIVRFLKQSVQSKNSFTQIESDISNTKQQSKNGTAASVEKVDGRALASSFQEAVTSYSEGKLTGVIVLERGYDSKKSEVWVTVGVSNKTMRAAKDVQKLINGDISPAATNAVPGAQNGTTPRSEIQRNKNYDNF
jgi:hypothetical protein